ncbi:MAG: redoxin domain-containing protein [Cyanobacteria bacterium SZAS-4]|nr:redoxin domain-containing protein [Cyanobacteria bacterium SZAS-4]
MRLLAIIFSLFLLSGCGKTQIPAVTVKAPELTESKDWLNTSKPLKLSELKGKVVLLDFWNLSCVNCFHTIPILKELQARYPKELVIIGVHTPKYDSEKDTKPLQEAVQRLEMDYPVVNDNDNEIWTDYGLKAYPTIVLIDPAGGLVKMMIGERSYQQLDQQVKSVIDQFKANGQIDEKPLVAKSESTPKDTPLRFPEKLCVDSKRKMLYIADSGHNRIIVSTLDGKLVNVIGTGKIGFADGSYANAAFHHPRGLAIDGDSLYVADTQNQRLRKIDLKNQTVSTISGDGQLTEILAPPDFGDAKQARLNSPWDLIMANNKLYVTMAGSHQLYVLYFNNNHIYAFAGSGDEGLRDGPLLTADLAQPSGIAFSANKIYFTDSESNSVRTADVDPKSGKVQTIVGKGLEDFGDMDGTLTKAFLKHPLGLAVAGNKIYVADTLNHKIRTIDLSTKMVSTLWGSGKVGDAVGDYPQFNEPNGVALFGQDMYIADTNNNEIKVGNLSTGRVTAFKIKGLAPP